MTIRGDRKEKQMAAQTVEIIPLKAGEAPPQTEMAVVVGPAEDDNPGMKLTGSWTYFAYAPAQSDDLERCIENAKAHAASHGLKRIYVIGGGDIVGNG
jgi:hypothetical protein